MKSLNQNRYGRCAMALLMATSLSGCVGMWDRLTHVGAEPALAKIENPTEVPGYQPVSMPMPETNTAGSSPRNPAAMLKTCGSGLERVMLVPSEMASKNP